MPCKNCNCGKAENMQKKAVVETAPETNIDVGNRLYLLGFLTSYFYLDSPKVDEDLIKNLFQTFPDDISLDENKLIGVESPTLQNFFMNSEEKEFLPMVEFLNRTDSKKHKYFWRGYIDGYGDSIHSDFNETGVPYMFVVFYNENLLTAYLGFLGLSECQASISETEDGGSVVKIVGNQALDVIHQIYSGDGFRLGKHYQKYLEASGHVPTSENSFKFSKARPDAVAPFKARASDSGYDLTLLEKVKTVGDVDFYDTGIKISPAYGYYFDVVPRSSLSKTGYMLANSVGIIDRTYTGNVLVPLRKVDKEAKDIELPIRLVQIIPRKIIHIDFEEVTDVGTTQRGEGGFGSTNG